MEIIHVNCGLRNEYESDLCSNEHDNEHLLNSVFKIAFTFIS